MLFPRRAPRSPPNGPRLGGTGRRYRCHGGGDSAVEVRQEGTWKEGAFALIRSHEAYHIAFVELNSWVYMQ